MKLTNTLQFSDKFLRRMVSWCAKQLELPVRAVKAAEFKPSRRAWGGYARLQEMKINVRVGSPGEFPARTKKQRNGLQETIADPLEALVWVTTHELAHLDQLLRKSMTRQGGGRGGSEYHTNRLAYPILQAFRESRKDLLAMWSKVLSEPVLASPLPEPVELEPANPQPESGEPAGSRRTFVQSRAAKAQQMLTKWNRKFGLAKSKVRQYRKKVKYYEKRGVLPIT